MTDETINSGSVSLIRENEDGSADYQFNFSPEALAALTRLGILTAIQAGIAEAKRLNPDDELKQALDELNDAKAEQLTDEEFEALAEVYGKKETEQDIATTEKNIALMREQRDIELRVCVKEFFEKYLNRTEESDSGKMFNPIVVSCSRVMMTEPLNNLLAEMAELSGAKPKENMYD
jgi:hypothetical protein